MEAKKILYKAKPAASIIDLDITCLVKEICQLIDKEYQGKIERIFREIEDNAYLISAWESLEGAKTDEVCLAINKKRWQALKKQELE